MKLEITYASTFGEWEEDVTVWDGRADRLAYRNIRPAAVAGLERLSRVYNLCYVDLLREVRRWAPRWSTPVRVVRDGTEVPEAFFGLHRPPVEAKGDPRIPSSGLVDSFTKTNLFCDYGLGNESEFSYFPKVGG